MLGLIVFLILEYGNYEEHVIEDKYRTGDDVNGTDVIADSSDHAKEAAV